MAGLHSAKIFIGASPVTLISVDGDLVKECHGILEEYFANKPPVFSDVGVDGLPDTLDLFQIASTLNGLSSPLAIDVAGDCAERPVTSPFSVHLSPCSIHLSPGMGSDEDGFADESDAFADEPVEFKSDFAPVIEDVRSLNPSHNDSEESFRERRLSAREVVWLTDPPCKQEPDSAPWDPAAVSALRPSEYFCIGCDQAVPLCDRRQHNLKHRPLRCRLCSRALKSMTALLSHMRAHRFAGRRKRLLEPWQLHRKAEKGAVDPLAVERAPRQARRRSKAAAEPPRSLRPRSEGTRPEALGSQLYDLPPVLAPFDVEVRKPAVAMAVWKRPVILARRKTPGPQPKTKGAAVLRPGRKAPHALGKNYPLLVSQLVKKPAVSPPKMPATLALPKKRPVAGLGTEPVIAAPAKVRRGRGRPRKVVAAGTEERGRPRKSRRARPPPMACEKCPQVFASRYDLKVHQGGHQLQCAQCPMWFLNDYYVNLHREVFHPADGDGPREAAEHSEELADLLARSSDEASVEDRARSPGYRPNRQMPKRRLHVCSICHVRCANGILLRRHVSEHSHPERLECATCHRLFRKRASLKAHCAARHRPEPEGRAEPEAEDAGPLPCRGCDALLVSELRLAEHYCTSHINLALLGCGLCQQVLTLAQMRTHASVHIV